MSEPIDFIKAVRTLRKERDLTYEQAKDEVVRFFNKKGWPLPQVFRNNIGGSYGS